MVFADRRVVCAPVKVVAGPWLELLLLLLPLLRAALFRGTLLRAALLRGTLLRSTLL